MFTVRLRMAPVLLEGRAHGEHGREADDGVGHDAEGVAEGLHLSGPVCPSGNA